MVEAGVAHGITSTRGGSAPGRAFSLRPFRPEDLPYLSEIDQQCFPPGIAYDQRELAAYIERPDTLTLVAEEVTEEVAEQAAKQAAEKPVRSDQTGARQKHSNASQPATPIRAFIVAQKLRRGISHIITIDVLPHARRSGLGTKLMNEVERELRKTGIESIFLEVAVNNAAAIQFYKRHGYFVLKTIPRYYQGELDAFLMVKRLPQD